MNQQNTADFSQGSVGSRIMAQAIPLSLAEIVQLLYNIVDDSMESRSQPAPFRLGIITLAFTVLPSF